MSEQEIPIDGSQAGDIVPSKQDAQDTESIEKNIQKNSKIVSAEPPRLSGDLDPNASQKDILDFVLELSQEKMIPWEPVWLPSRGVYYDGAIPDGKVEIKGMGIHAEKILATQRYAQTGYTLEYLFKQCVRFPVEYDPLDLVDGDRTYLLYALRGITHGHIYEFLYTCTNDSCKAVSSHSYNLNLLMESVTYPADNLPEPFRVVLPYLSEMVGREFFVKIRLMRGHDMQHIREKQRIMRRIGGSDNLTIDQTLEQNLNLIIKEAMGETDSARIERLVGKMHARDTATIRQFLRKKSPGIDTSIKLDCPECGEEMDIGLPLTESFFRPAERTGNGTGVEPPDGAIVPT